MKWGKSHSAFQMRTWPTSSSISIMWSRSLQINAGVVVVVGGSLLWSRGPWIWRKSLDAPEPTAVQLICNKTCSPSRVLGRAYSTCRVISCCPRLWECTQFMKLKWREGKRDFQRMGCMFVGEDEKSLAGLAAEGCKLRGERRYDYSK